MFDTEKEINVLSTLIASLDELRFRKFFKRCVAEVIPRNCVCYSHSVPAGESILMEVSISDVGLPSFWIFQIDFIPSGLAIPEHVMPFFKHSLDLCLRKSTSLPGFNELIPGNFTVPREESLVEYMYILNIVGIDDKIEERVEKTAKEMFQKYFDLDIEVESQFTTGIKFGFGTASSIIEGVGREHTTELLGEFLRMPTAYALLAREGQIVITESRFHDLCVAGSPERPGKEKSVLPVSLCSSNPLSSDLRDVAKELCEIINRPRVSEYEVQKFIESNPIILESLNEQYCEIRPQVCLIDENENRLIPDFLLGASDPYLWKIVELKLPTDKLFIGENQEKISAPMARGISQLLQYQNFFEKKENRKIVKEKFGIECYEPALTLVIGRDTSNRLYEWRHINRMFPSVKVVPYDSLLSRLFEYRKSIEHLIG